MVSNSWQSGVYLFICGLCLATQFCLCLSCSIGWLHLNLSSYVKLVIFYLHVHSHSWWLVFYVVDRPIPFGDKWKKNPKKNSVAFRKKRKIQYDFQEKKRKVQYGWVIRILLNCPVHTKYWHGPDHFVLWAWLHSLGILSRNRWWWMPAGRVYSGSGFFLDFW